MSGEPSEDEYGGPIEDLSVGELLSAVEAASPLVHHLTNDVTTSETANVTLHWGGLPVMADAPAESGDMAAGADAVVINTGTASTTDVDAMVDAGRRANEAGVPVVLDPVGYGATPHRVESVGRLLDAVAFDVIKGNAGEVRGLAGEEATVRGVESVGESDAGVADAARALAAETGAVVVASGATDIVADGERAYELAVGHERMGSFVGSGCMLASTLGTFAAVVGEGDGPPASTTEAALAGCAAYGLAGERAAERDPAGPASYRTAFMDAVAALASERPALDVASRIEKV
ncbi:hydroxyethylthiazole kinase [Halorubrum saccharovorum DSM 1137]|uniref:Hydroxyethylthiazole kinase n=1 Tax=Halorubrum saccharovorum DSM 1137 TaxID=1227484 RepID=M0E3R1_9EURY|nr:hydroxyethylthiazole kinase [Halorubrum saccharovorum]ELZ42425.1 hydroxyethylthiazole kinase [Halorubrum saccharovorum DSM 1137]